MSKKVKYEMYINTFNTLGLPFQISKKEFLRQLEHYKLSIRENHKAHEEEIYESGFDKARLNNEGILDNLFTETTEYEKYIETRYAVHDDGACIVLSKKECKPGYCWR